MIIDINSKVDTDLICHRVIRPDPDYLGRIDLSGAQQPLQAASINYAAPEVFAAHQHILKDCPPRHVTQESWVVVSGTVFVRFFDTDGQFLEVFELGAGDCSITFHGGHAYKLGPSGATVYEFKTGPYHGQEKDKAFIDDRQPIA